MSERRAFTGQVGRDGKLKLDAPVLFAAAVAKMKGKRVTVTVEHEKAIRSGEQNRRFFGVVVPVCTEILNQQLEAKGSDAVLSKDEVHKLLDGAFIGKVETDLGMSPKKCSLLDTAAFSAYMDEVERHFRTRYGAIFPTEEDVREAGL